MDRSKYPTFITLHLFFVRIVLEPYIFVNLITSYFFFCLFPSVQFKYRIIFHKILFSRLLLQNHCCWFQLFNDIVNRAQIWNGLQSVQYVVRLLCILYQAYLYILYSLWVYSRCSPCFSSRHRIIPVDSAGRQKYTVCKMYVIEFFCKMPL